MKLPAENSVTGAWIDKSTLRSGDVMKIVSEAKIEVGQLGEQLVCRVKVKGGDNEVKNFAINRPSKKAIIEVYGDDTLNWIDKTFEVAVEKTVIGGKRVLASYLLPDGFQLGEDEGGYLVVQRKPFVIEGGERVHTTEDINPEDIPF